MGSSMKKIQIIIGLILVLMIPISYAEQLELFSVVHLKDKKTLSLRAWPSKKSKIIALLSASSTNVKYLGKHKLANKIDWMKVRWKEKQGWVDSYFLKKQSINKNKPEINSNINRNNHYQQKSKRLPPAELIEEPIFTNPNKQADRYGKLIQTPIPRSLKTRIGARGHVFSAQRLQRFKLGCQGSKSNKWRLKMNMKTKRMWVNLKNARTYSIPIIYSRWNNDSRKRMIVVAGRGRKHERATIRRSHSCRLDYSKRRYAYSISAKVAHTGRLSGCCSDITR
jgi:hypothetical protein